MSFLKIDLEDTFSSALRAKLREAGPRAAHAVAEAIKTSTEPFVPARNKVLVNRTQVIDGQVIYPGPYARYLYYGKVMVFTDPPYLRNVNGKAILTHFGQRKTPIDKPLKISQSVHPQATSHWFEASKAQNLDKWVKAAEGAITRELDK